MVRTALENQVVERLTEQLGRGARAAAEIAAGRSSHAASHTRGRAPTDEARRPMASKRSRRTGQGDPVATARGRRGRGDDRFVTFPGDLDADSLDLVELIMELKDQFGIKITDDEAQKLGTVAKAVDFVLAHQVAWMSSRALVAARLPSGACWSRLHPHLVDGGPGKKLRTAGVPRGRRARFPLRALPSVPGAPRRVRLAKLRAHVVSRRSCAVVARVLDLGSEFERERERRNADRAGSAQTGTCSPRCSKP